MKSLLKELLFLIFTVAFVVITSGVLVYALTWLVCWITGWNVLLGVLAMFVFAIIFLGAAWAVDPSEEKDSCLDKFYEKCKKENFDPYE
jgi:hypothetical protein